MSRRLIRAAVGGLSALLVVLVVVLVTVSAAAPDAPAGSVVLAPHGAAPLIYAGAGDRAQLNALWRFKADRDDVGLAKGYPKGTLKGKLVRLPFVPDATRISGSRGVTAFRGMVGWYRTVVQVPADGLYALLGGTAGDWIRNKNLGLRRAGRYFTGGIYVALGAVAAISNKD